MWFRARWRAPSDDRRNDPRRARIARSPREVAGPDLQRPRGRLEVMVLIDFGSETVAIPVLSDTEVKALLTPAPTNVAERWTCGECGAVNDRSRRWCQNCSSHQVA